MARRSDMRRLSWLFLGAALIAGPAQNGEYKPPRTASGVPDLQGIWTNTALTFLQRPPIFKGLIATEAEAAMSASFTLKPRTWSITRRIL